MLNICVCVSGGGTNLKAIMDSIADGTITNTKIVGVVSNNKNAFALERAKENHIPAVCVSPKDYASREEFYNALLNTVKGFQPDLVVLAGFLVNLPAQMIEEFKNRIINIHPSLIPSFCGVGYYGLKVHEAVLERGVKVTGATVHVVDGGIDTGKILLQKAVDVREDDTPKTLQQSVIEQAEWKILPEAIHKIANGQL